MNSCTPPATQLPRRSAGPLAVALLITATGCFGGPSAVKPLAYDSEQIADALLKQYDKNSDGALSEEEYAQCPAMVDSLKNGLDQDRDKKITRSELAARLQRWVTGGVGASPFTCCIIYKGRPLEGAVVKFAPEAAYEGAIQPANGVAGPTGLARMAMDPANLPSDLQGLKAVQQGFYRIEVTSDRVSLPAKYNTATTLGVEISFETGRNLVTFNL